MTAQDGVVFADAEERALQRQFEQAEQRFEVGLTAVTDVHEARAGYDNARARAIVSKNNLADAKEALYELTGQYFDDIDPNPPFGNNKNPQKIENGRKEKQVYFQVRHDQQKHIKILYSFFEI